MPISHSKVSAKSDGADSSLVRPSDWNAAHDLSAFTASDVPYGAPVGSNLVENDVQEVLDRVYGATTPLYRPQFPVGKVDEWDDEAGLVTGVLGYTLANVTRSATGGPSGEPSLQSNGSGTTIGIWGFDPGDVVQVEIDVKTDSGGASFLSVVTSAGTFRLNDDTVSTWAHKRAVFTIGASGNLALVGEAYNVSFANLFIYKVARYPILTAWYTGDADTTLTNGETWGGSSTREATAGRTGASCMRTTTGAGPTTMLTLSGLVVGQVYRIEAWIKPLNGGGTFLQATVNAGTTNINSDVSAYWRRSFANVTVGASQNIVIKNTWQSDFADFVVTQVGA